MKYSQATRGRTFVIRLEDGDILDTCIESFAREKGIQAASLIAVGGADAGSRLVVGPAQSRSETVTPLQHTLSEAHEIAGTGTLFPDKNGNPVLHMHLACGREGQGMTGCARSEVKAWHVIEVVLQELTDTGAKRLDDPVTGFELLVP